MKKSIQVISVLAAGIVIGAAVGILFAPASGEETRKKLSTQGKKLADTIDKQLEGGKETLEELQTVLQKQLKKVNDKLGKSA